MTDGYVTADPTAWATAHAEYLAAQAAFSGLPDCTDRSAVDNASDDLIKAEVAVLGLHSPDLAAVIKKLEIFWEEDMLGDCLETFQRRMVIGDLHRIAFQQ